MTAQILVMKEEKDSTYRGDAGEMQGRCRGDAGEMQGRYRGGPPSARSPPSPARCRSRTRRWAPAGCRRTYGKSARRRKSNLAERTKQLLNRSSRRTRPPCPRTTQACAGGTRCSWPCKGRSAPTRRKGSRTYGESARRLPIGRRGRREDQPYDLTYRCGTTLR